MEFAHKMFKYLYNPLIVSVPDHCLSFYFSNSIVSAKAIQLFKAYQTLCICKQVTCLVDLELFVPILSKHSCKAKLCKSH